MFYSILFLQQIHSPHERASSRKKIQREMIKKEVKKEEKEEEENGYDEVRKDI